MYLHKCGTILAPFVQFKKRKKHPWRSGNFSKVAGFNLKNVKNTHGRVLILKLTLLHGCFSRFLNCTNGTKSHNASQVTK